MALKSSQKKSRSSLSSVSLVKFETHPPSATPNRFNPLTAFKSSSSSQKTNPELSASQGPSKGKAKAKEISGSRPPSVDNEADERLWIDVYEPTTEAELAVHKRKVDDIRRWFHEAFEGGPSGALKKYRRILALTGNAGTAKTTTVRVLAREMGFEIMEWRNASGGSSPYVFDTDNGTPADGGNEYYSTNYGLDDESASGKFEAFLNRASSCQNIMSPYNSSSTPQPSKPSQKRHIILLEDLPNILHPGTQQRFHAALEMLVKSPISDPSVPIVVIVSDAGLRGELTDERLAHGGAFSNARDSVVDIRAVLPRDLLGGPYVTQIGFNPIAPTLMTKALQALLSTQFLASPQSPPLKEVVDAIVESANGDIRSAIMALQFACIVQRGGKVQKKKTAEKMKGVVLESVTRREQTLVLFHLLGKVFYNKRKGDPPSLSASIKDVQREKAIDAQLKDPPRLPCDLRNHERRTSRINVDTLYADSPIDSSLFSLYIHQNYPQFCDDIEQCDGVADWLSWVDSSGGDAWYQANPHQFHLLTLGTLHSLPSPVTRRSQKVLKPVFFESLQRQKNAWQGVRDAWWWCLEGGTGQTKQLRGWSQTEIATELGGILKARDLASQNFLHRPPPSHRLFSHLKFSVGAVFGIPQVLDEKEIHEDTANIGVQEGLDLHLSRGNTEVDGGWLDSDDIEDF